MKPVLDRQSADRLLTCDPKLQELVYRVLQGYPLKVLEGHRDKDRQNRLFKEKKTQVKWPESKHNRDPSYAVDMAPAPVDFGDKKWGKNKAKTLARFYHFAGYVKRVADEMGIKVRWGGDWDGDGEFTDQKFDDLVHWELA